MTEKLPAAITPTPRVAGEAVERRVVAAVSPLEPTTTWTPASTAVYTLSLTAVALV